MGVLRYRLRGFARTRTGTLVLLSLAVAVAGGLSLALVAGARRTLTVADRYSESRGRVFDLTVQQDSGPARTPELAGLPSVRRVALASFVFGGALGPDGEGLDTLVFAGSVDSFGDQLVAGRLPDPARPGDFVATKGVVDAAQLEVGDRLRIATLTQQQADTAGFGATDPQGPTVDGTLVGVMDGPSTLADDYDVIVMPASALDQGDVGIAATVGAVALRPGSTEADLRAQLDALPDGNRISLSPAEWVPGEVRQGLDAQGKGIAILAAIVSLAAVVVLGQLLARQLRLDAPERSILAAIGCSRSQRVGDPIARVALCVAIGATGAIGVAWATSNVFPVGFAARVEPNPGRHLDAVAVLLGALVLAAAALVWAGAAFALDLRKRRPETTRTLADRLASSVPSARAGTALRFAFTGAGTRPARSAVLGLALVVAVTIGALTFAANLERLVDQPLQWGQNFDLMLGQGEDQIADDVQQAVVDSRDVSDVALFGSTSATVGSDSVAVVGVDQLKGEIDPELVRGTAGLGSGAVAVGPLTAGDLGVDVGDDVTFTTGSGDHTLEVSAIVLVPTVGGVDDLGHAVIVSADTLRQLDPEATMNTAGIRIAKGARPGALDRVGRLVGGGGPGDRPPTILNLARVRAVPFLVAAAVGFLGVLSLTNLMVVAVRRRRRDLAVLSALGASPRWLRGVVRWQASVVTAVVLVVAIPPGVIGGRVLYRSLVEHIGAATDMVVPIGRIATVALVTIALANLVAAIPRWWARRVQPVRLLTEE